MPVGHVGDAETLTRYAYEKSYFRADGTVKPKAFHPDAAGLCSVMVTTGLANKAIQLIAAQYVTPHRKGLKLLGYAGVSCSSVRGVGLDARYDEPPPKHANIFGYPDDREKMMERAMLLAATATFQKL